MKPIDTLDEQAQSNVTMESSDLIQSYLMESAVNAVRNFQHIDLLQYNY